MSDKVQALKLACGCGATLSYTGAYPESHERNFWKVHEHCIKTAPKPPKGDSK